MRLLLKKCRVISPEIKEGEYDILLDRKRILRIGKGLRERGAREINLRGLLTFPGFIDAHVHLRDPGEEFKEDIKSGTKAAAWGGFTAVACMPNTKPVNDNPAVTKYILERARKVASIKVLVVGALTKGLAGKEMAEIGKMWKEGTRAFSDDGRWVVNSSVMRRVMEYTLRFDVPVISHAEDPTLSEDGVVNEGVYSTLTGLKGIPAEAEDIAVFRDLCLCEITGACLHITHVSSKGALEIIRKAKKKGLPVTCDVTPHHLSFTDKDVVKFDSNFKMKPPLRSVEDRNALLNGLSEGTVDFIATDHAPHDKASKEVEFNIAPFGVIGLQTALPVALSLVKEKVITLRGLVEKLSTNPARFFRLKGWGVIKEGAVASITAVDMDVEWTFTEEVILSKSVNSPFLGMKLKGRALLTISEGQIAYIDEKVLK